MMITRNLRPQPAAFHAYSCMIIVAVRRIACPPALQLQRPFFLEQFWFSIYKFPFFLGGGKKPSFFYLYKLTPIVCQYPPHFSLFFGETFGDLLCLCCIFFSFPTSPKRWSFLKTPRGPPLSVFTHFVE